MIELKNLGTVNKNKVELGNHLTLWFSYETIVAYWLTGAGLRVSENVWSQTTGKMINELQPDKSKRIKRDQFEREVAAIMDSIKIDKINANLALAELSK